MGSNIVIELCPYLFTHSPTRGRQQDTLCYHIHTHTHTHTVASRGEVPVHLAPITSLGVQPLCTDSPFCRGPLPTRNYVLTPFYAGAVIKKQFWTVTS